MRVKRDFALVYRTQDDPWAIGDATSDRYNLYRELILRHAQVRGSMLDIGCGFGAFLARFRDDFESLVGVDISRDAIRKGEERYPFITYVQGSADDLPRASGLSPRYDAIVYSDVICYFDEAGKRRSLEWIASRLADDGLAFIAAWCPGGKYLTYDELARLVERYFKVEHGRMLPSEHALFLARRKKHIVAVTVDYETWQPIPPGRSIDWEEDVFRPAERLLELCGELGIPLTLMAEMGEYFWLREHDEDSARRMEEQWAEAVRAGHDVQLHLHPCWLPELGARRAGGEWRWDLSRSKADDYPGDLAALVGRCKAALESAGRRGNPGYRVTAFRAGAYQVQPFKRLYDALSANGIFCDSSVHTGGVSAERGYDFSLAYSAHQPYFANAYDPQLKAPPAERAIVEIPILTFGPGDRWCLDGAEGRRIASRLLSHLREDASLFRTSESFRRMNRAKALAADLYSRLKPARGALNRILPRAVAHFTTAYGPETLAGHEYFVLTGHTKGAHDFGEIANNLRALREDGRFEFVTLSAMAGEARRELAESVRESAGEEARHQVRREYKVVMGDARNDAQSHALQARIPLDRNSVLDLGCGAGHWAARISGLYPWMRVTGVDCGLDFLKSARRGHPSPRLAFLAGDFQNLPFPGGSFDCVYADNSLEHAFDVDGVLSELSRVLRKGGVLVAAVPSDARNPGKICDNHTWKTAPHELRLRLGAAGFVGIRVEEVDTYRVLGLPPYPPSNDRMMYIEAWKRDAEASKEERALEVMDWVYRKLSPDKPQESNDAVEILARGHAYCMGYAIVLGELLRREGYSIKWVTMFAEDHPRGSDPGMTDTHEVLSVDLGGREVTLDPMANTCIPHPVSEIVRNPGLAGKKERPDGRYLGRGYHLYDTKFW
ncbi:MAG: methyltransferase domain-containing protein, partial [Deltaproteobacteria bacterium]|nr:methyltransferase domain-containing protein [Deltaproteobacteria bacterium]